MKRKKLAERLSETLSDIYYSDVNDQAYIDVDQGDIVIAASILVLAEEIESLKDEITRPVGLAEFIKRCVKESDEDLKDSQNEISFLDLPDWPGVRKHD